jgi:hypothetical protein
VKQWQGGEGLAQAEVKRQRRHGLLGVDGERGKVFALYVGNPSGYGATGIEGAGITNAALKPSFTLGA